MRTMLIVLAAIVFYLYSKRWHIAVIAAIIIGATYYSGNSIVEETKSFGNSVEQWLINHTPNK